MALSRREFFGRIRDVAEGPHRWREKRIAMLREYALAKAPGHWTAAQREETGRAIERKLVYMSDDSLRGSSMRRYVEAIIQSKELYFEAGRAEQEQYPREDSYYDDYSG